MAVARQSIDEAKHRLHNVVVIDTAGRLGIDAQMMAQAAAIADATDPDEILFVVDAKRSARTRWSPPRHSSTVSATTASC